MTLSLPVTYLSMMLARGNLIVEVLEAETELMKNPFVRRNTRGIH